MTNTLDRQYQECCRLIGHQIVLKKMAEAEISELLQEIGRLQRISARSIQSSNLAQEEEASRGGDQGINQSDGSRGTETKSAEAKEEKAQEEE